MYSLCQTFRCSMGFSGKAGWHFSHCWVKTFQVQFYCQLTRRKWLRVGLKLHHCRKSVRFLCIGGFQMLPLVWQSVFFFFNGEWNFTSCFHWNFTAYSICVVSVRDKLDCVYQSVDPAVMWATKMTQGELFLIGLQLIVDEQCSRAKMQESCGG